MKNLQKLKPKKQGFLDNFCLGMRAGQRVSRRATESPTANAMTLGAQ